MEESLKRYNTAAQNVCKRLRDPLLTVTPEIKCDVQEIRLRCGGPLVLYGLFGTLFVCRSGRTCTMLPDDVLLTTREDIAETFRIASGYSVHTHQNSIRNGYISLSGGHRLGICGTAVCENDSVSTVRELSTLNIRISKEHKGSADALMNSCFSSGASGLIIAGAPSSGKTTLLRDLTRRLANSNMRVSLIDERGEIAAVQNGIALNDVGINCDIFSSYPKSAAILMALRTMSPDVIVLDEVGSTLEIDAINQGVNSGVKFVVSVHAGEYADLFRRPQIKKLLETDSFEYIALLRGGNRPCVIDRIIPASEVANEIFRADSDCCGRNDDRVLCRFPPTFEG